MTKEQFMQACAFDIVTAIRNTIEQMGLVDSGNLKRSIIFEVKNNSIRLIFPDYMEYIEFGTAPHVITPTNKKALMFEGLKHPIKKVMHPGTKPYAVIRTTLHRELKNIIKKNMEKYL